MTVLIAASKLDPAGQNISQVLKRRRNFQPTGSDGILRSGDVLLKDVDSDGIYTESLGVNEKVDAVIFASRHRSEQGDPTLTVHSTGNCTGRAEFGGKPKSLAIAGPTRIRAALLALDAARETWKLNYAVSLEATHHGPTELGIPILFVEIGSTEKQWNDQQAAEAVAEAIWTSATAPSQGTIAVGFGGGHYCNKQCIALRKNGYAFGHILSKYFFEDYDEQVVRMAFDRTLGECRTALIDWKGIRGSDRAKLLAALKNMNIEIVRV